MKTCSRAWLERYWELVVKLCCSSYPSWRRVSWQTSMRYSATSRCDCPRKTCKPTALDEQRLATNQPLSTSNRRSVARLYQALDFPVSIAPRPTTVQGSDVVLETNILVSRRLEDKKNIGPEKSLVHTTVTRCGDHQFRTSACAD